MKHAGRRTLAIAMSVAALGTAPATADTIRVQSTTDTVDAGLVEGLLRDGYKAAQPGDELDYVGVGTGRALDNARSGIADVVITHAPTLEQKFQDDGFSLEGLGRAIFYSDYVIVGPKSDPAGVKTAADHDAVAAFEKIAAANAPNGPRASFISRGDASGTNVQEQLMWALTGDAVPKQTASNAGGAAGRSEPAVPGGAAGTYPTWYRKAVAGQAANLRKTNACAPADAPDGNCYTLVDRGTFNKVESSGTLTNLAILSENNDASARGGKDLLINPFSAYIVNQEKLPAGSAPVNVAAATRFLNYLTSPGFQTAVDSFPNATNPAFRGDAFPSVSIDTALPPTAPAGAEVPVALTLRNKLPGGPAVAAKPVQLQSSTDGGTTWADVGSPVSTDAAGRVSFTPKVTATTRYRVALGRFQSTSWSAFSPSTQEIGSVSLAAPVTVATTPTTPSTPTTAAKPVTPVAPKKDRVAARASKVALTRRRLTLRLNEASTVKVTLARRTVKRVRRNGKVRRVVSYRTAKTVRGTTKRAATLKLTLKTPIRAGIYRVTVRSVDAAGNVRTQKRRLTIKG